ncbi:MAG: Gfo/Idh/MocA family oxidoreductase [Calditrichaceae bacterium]|nr:Gfo/Idh/MocA family oxidoreductase [Calditrichaceae bacterium]MBN2708383.1 Gfo/Idh/MocA family oxidoreductase [Calditrichaceae bacterium]
MKHKIKWGIMATGGIAHSFTQDLLLSNDAIVTAVGSRSIENAKKFADKYKIPKYYGTYEELAADPDIDIIYVASPHAFHYHNTMLCLENNKHVLCEKAFAINAVEAEKMIALARKKNLFLMEAMWTRYMPVVKKALKMIRDGLIGDVRLINADFCRQPEYDPANRFFNPDLGGGALLDLGIYPIAMTFLLAGKPDYITSAAKIGATRVDEQCGMIFTYKSGLLAHLFASLITLTDSDVVIVGSKGKIRLHGPVCIPQGMTVSLHGKADKYEKAEIKGNGYTYEALEVMDCLNKDKTESAIMPLDESLEIMKTMDQLRKQWGLVYPNDKQQGLA